jgi:hypothetical protein
MRYGLSLLLLLAWGLWFGGQVTLVILIVTLFRSDRSTAVRAGPVLFHVFERYQLGVAVVAIAAAAGLMLVQRRRLLLGILACSVLAAVGGVVSVTTVTPKMEALWSEGRSEGPEFQQLHRQSSNLYRGELLLLLAVGCMLPAVLSQSRATTPEPA